MPSSSPRSNSRSPSPGFSTMAGSPRRSQSRSPLCSSKYTPEARGGVTKATVRLSRSEMTQAHDFVCKILTFVHDPRLPRSDISEWMARDADRITKLLTCGKVNDYLCALRAWISMKAASSYNLALGFATWYIEHIVFRVWTLRQATFGVVDEDSKDRHVTNFCAYVAEFLLPACSNYYNRRERTNAFTLPALDDVPCNPTSVINDALYKLFGRKCTGTTFPTLATSSTAALAIGYAYNQTSRNCISPLDAVKGLNVFTLACGSLTDYVKQLPDWISYQLIENSAEVCATLYYYIMNVLLPVWTQRQTWYGFEPKTSRAAADSLHAFIMEALAGGYTEYASNEIEEYCPEKNTGRDKKLLCDSRNILRAVLNDCFMTCFC